MTLVAKPEVDVTFVSGEQIAEGALDHVDALIIPGGVRKKMWSAANPLIERFKVQGYPVCTSCKDINL
ncbi:MAG: hypothetical protein J6N18_00070 [Kiritimatiellae bacterium]|nr:hypothetical protein [Kiritimatiellia bacterium]